MTGIVSTPQSQLVVRKCRVCEWQGEVIERPGEMKDCPWCHGPTDLVSIVPPPQVIGEKNPHATALGRMGGAKGGQARAAALTAKRRSAIAMKAAKARWSKTKRPKR
jgi:hypothetical protein